MKKEPFCLMVKPVGSACNMRCRYCYYIDKKHESQVMADETIDLLVRQYADAQPEGDLTFVWHGGEPTLAGLDFYRRVVDIQGRRCVGRKFYNCLQTNGILLDDDWCRFLSDNGWLVGLSIDGDAVANRLRVTPGGKDIFGILSEVINMLDCHHVEWNAMATVNAANVDKPLEFYDFFRHRGVRYIQFTPIVERLDSSGCISAPNVAGTMSEWSVTPEQWGNFLCTVFDEWRRTDIGRIFIQIFDAVLAGHLGATPGVCTLSGKCGSGPVVEADGSVYSCDHFVFPELHLGNIHDRTIGQMLNSSKHLSFCNAKTDTLCGECLECPFLGLCRGECPKNRFVDNSNGSYRRNYLCRGYQRFFAYSYEIFSKAADEIKARHDVF